MRACPPEWKWLFATLQRYNVKHKHNQGKRVANGIACSKEGGNATSTLHSRGSPNKGGQNQKSKAPLGVTMMPLGAPSISKYGSLVRPDAQIVALRAHCARTSRALRLRRPLLMKVTAGPVHIPKWKGANPYPQLERAMQKAWIRALYQKSPKKMPSACLAR